MWVARAGFLLAGLMVACETESVCEEAVDKLEECNGGLPEGQPGFNRLPLAISRDDCSGTNECLAKCVAPASCAELKYAVQGGSTDPNSPPVLNGPKLLACLLACGE